VEPDRGSAAVADACGKRFAAGALKMHGRGMDARSGRRQESGGILSQPAAHGGQLDRTRRESIVQICDRYTYKSVSPAVPAERGDLEIDLDAEGRQRRVGTCGEVRDDDVGPGERDPAVGRQGVVGEPVVTGALVRTRDPERRDRSSAKSGDRVDGLTGRDS